MRTRRDDSELCSIGSAPCPVIDWAGLNRRTHFRRAGFERSAYAWYGSLVTGGADAAGLLFMRNRSYDPESGAFTQPDPIGLAGGMNLYGYAGGDPINFWDPFRLRPVYVACRPVGGTNDDDESLLGHCAVRVVNDDLGVDVTFELSPEMVEGNPWLVNQMVASGPGSDRTAAYGDAWVQVGVPSGMSRNEFDRAVLRSASVTSLRLQGTPYFFTGNMNSNRFVFDAVSRAGGTVPAAASSQFRFAPGICGGAGLRRGPHCR